MDESLDEFDQVTLAGLPVVVAPSVPAATRGVLRLAERHRDRHKGTVVRLANAGNFSLCFVDPAYRLLFANSLNLPDGAPLASAVRYVSPSEHATQVRGPSLFTDVMKESPTDVHHYFLGGTPETLSQLLNRAQERFPGLHVAGFESPPFGPASPDEILAQAQRVAATKADIVWVGLGTPKQDYVATALANHYSAVYICVGAAFDFFAGTKREAPRLMQGLGLEWLYRLCREPRRLWRRYLIGNIRFCLMIAPEMVRRGRRPESNKAG